MFNITSSRKGNILTITVDLSKEKGPSTTGKTIIVASTEGNAKIEGEGNFQMGVNVFKKPGA